MAKTAQFTTTVFTLWLLLASGTAAQLTSGKSSSLFSGDRPQPLPIEIAFPFYVSFNHAQGMTVSWQPAADHYLYRHRFAFSLKSPNSPALIPLGFSLPDGLKKRDEFFGDIEAYYDRVTANLDIETDQAATTTLVIQFQGCADWGFCYPPQSVEYPLNP